jgi:hypothetical protein
MKSWTQVIETRAEAVHLHPDDWTPDMAAAAGATGVIAYEVAEPVAPGSVPAPPVDMAAIVNAAVDQALEKLLERLGAEAAAPAPAPAAAPAPEVEHATETANQALNELHQQLAAQGGATPPVQQ